MARKNNSGRSYHDNDLDFLFEQDTQQPATSFKKDEIEDLLKKHPEMDRSIAGQIVSGNYSLNRYLADKKRKVYIKRDREIEKLMEQYPQLTKSTAGQIVSGNLDLEFYLKRMEIEKIKQDKRDQFKNRLNKLLEENPDLTEKTAKKIASGQITLEDYLASVEKKRLKQEKYEQSKKQSEDATTT